MPNRPSPSGTHLGIFGLCRLAFLAAIIWGALDVSAEPSATHVTPLAELNRALSHEGRAIQSFQVEGIVCAIAAERKLVALQDNSACILFEMSPLDGTIRVGDRIKLSGDHCTLTRSRFGIQLGTAPVVNNDGHHAAFFKMGQVYLEHGMQPMRVTWFNGFGDYALRLEYEGPGIRRQTIAPSALWHKSPNATEESDLRKGLAFDAYTGDWYYASPDFDRLKPVAHGVATNIDARYRIRSEDTGLVFNGYLKVTNDGIYTFYLSSDDGGYLYVGNPATYAKVALFEHGTAPVPAIFNGTLADEDDHFWTGLEGEVTFAASFDKELDLEVDVKGQRVHLAVIDGATIFPNDLLGRHIRAAGILEALSDCDQQHTARLIVPGPGQIDTHIMGEAAKFNTPATNTLITSIAEIRNLTPAAAAQRLPGKVRGVVIWSSPNNFVIEDATGGAYIRYNTSNWVEQPRVGELWEIEGVSDPGDFSPVLVGSGGTFLGNAAMPEPLHPTRNQLLNGSLDAEYVELRGVLTEITQSNMTLLTTEGQFRIQRTDDHPLPYLPPASANRSLVDSIVRIRGCFTARWDKATRQVRARDIFISPGFVQIEELAPVDSYDLPTRRVADLLWFNPNASALERTKVKGEVVFARPGEYSLQDGPNGIRIRTKDPLLLEPGDVVEAVGFPQLGGASPVLQEARARVVAKQPLPGAVAVADLLNPNHDSTMVQVDALVLSDRAYGRERVLELQAGQNHFLARVKSSPSGAKLVPPGSQVRITGVYYAVGNEQASGNLDAFDLRVDTVAGIELLQQPPWWTVERALTIVAVLGGVLMIALIWITLLRRKVEERTKQLERQIEERQVIEQRRVMEQERTRVAQDLHDELGAGLTEMGFLGDLVKNPAVPSPEKQQYLGQMTDTARSLVASLDEIVWAVNPRYDSVPSLASYYTLFAQRFLDLAGVACRPQMPASFPDYPLDAKGRHNLFLAFKEALNNVVRHSGATEVNLKIEVGEGELIIFVSDNGHGFDAGNAAGQGEGLRSMRHRLEQLGGMFEITSQPGLGTHVEMRLPVGNHVV